MESRMKAIKARKKGLLDFNKPLKFMAERGRFRLNHPNSLNFIPVWLRLLHRPYP